MVNTAQRRTQEQRGSASIEFAVSSAVLITLMMGAAELGRAMYEYNTITKSVRAAARYLSANPAGDSTSQLAAKNLVVYGSTSGGTSSEVLVSTLAISQVSIKDSVSDPSTQKSQSTGAGTINLVTVSVTGFTFVPLASWVVPGFTFDTIQATMPQLL